MKGKQILKLPINQLNSFKYRPNNKLLVISFKLSAQSLGKKEVGRKILNFLYRIKKRKVNFKINEPLPRCLFVYDYDKITEHFKIPKNCFECDELFSVEENGMIRACHTLGNRLGPKLEYMNDRNQIYEYFKTFHQELKPSNKCKTCIWFVRDKCNGLCFKS